MCVWVWSVYVCVCVGGGVDKSYVELCGSFGWVGGWV